MSYIYIENNEAFLVTEKNKTEFYINGSIFYNPLYPLCHMVPITIKKPDKIENLGKMGTYETSKKIKDLIEKGVELR